MACPCGALCCSDSILREWLWLFVSKLGGGTQREWDTCKGGKNFVVELLVSTERGLSGRWVLFCTFSKNLICYCSPDLTAAPTSDDCAPFILINSSSPSSASLNSLSLFWCHCELHCVSTCSILNLLCHVSLCSYIPVLTCSWSDPWHGCYSSKRDKQGSLDKLLGCHHFSLCSRWSWSPVQFIPSMTYALFSLTQETLIKGRSDEWLSCCMWL